MKNWEISKKPFWQAVRWTIKTWKRLFGKWMVRKCDRKPYGILRIQQYPEGSIYITMEGTVGGFHQMLVHALQNDKPLYDAITKAKEEIETKRFEEISSLIAMHKLLIGTQVTFHKHK